MKVLAILFGWCILLNGSDFAAMQGGVVLYLDVAGSWIVPYVPVISLVIYIAAVVLILRDRKRWRRWVLFVAATVVCHTMIAYPIWIYHRNVHRIILKSKPSREWMIAFESHFLVKTKWYSNSSEGRVLAVSKTDYSDEMESFVKAAEPTVSDGK
jgi:hypothetical protein